jgi:hypothetical protein
MESFNETSSEPQSLRANPLYGIASVVGTSEHDPRIKEGICGVTEIGATGIERICIAAPHAKVYIRKTSGKGYTKGDLIFSESPKTDQHYFVTRWPNRQKE